LLATDPPKHYVPGVNEMNLPVMLPEVAERNAEELVAEEEREKRKAQRRKAKKKRRREKKKEEKEMNSANNKNKSNTNSISKRETVCQSNKKMTNRNSKR